MRGVIGLALIIVGASMGWLIVIGKFPPHAASPGLLSVLKNIQAAGIQPATNGAGKPGTGLATVGQVGSTAVKGK
jgi:hypothetical protein